MAFDKFFEYALLAGMLYPIVGKIVAGYRRRGTKDVRIDVIELNGVIQYSEKPDSVYVRTMEVLDAVEADKPKALIVRVNSPGGSVGATHEIYAKLKSLADKGMTIVAMMEDVAASGGLYVAMAAQHIVATPGTITGSIGVIMKGYDISELLPFLKIKTRVHKSGEFKDMGSLTRPSTEAEDSLLSSMVQDVLGGFCDIIATSRKIDPEVVKGFADGRILTGRQALELKLIDKLGSFADAVKVARELAKIPEGKEKVVPITSKKKKSSLKSLLFGQSSGAHLRSLVEQALPGLDLQGLPLLLMRRF